MSQLNEQQKKKKDGRKQQEAEALLICNSLALFLPLSFSLLHCPRVCVCLRNENENQATASSQKQINALSGRQVIYLAIVRCFLLSSEFAVAASAIAAAATVAVCVWALPQHPLPPHRPQPQPEQATQTTQAANHFEWPPLSSQTHSLLAKGQWNNFQANPQVGAVAWAARGD